MPDRYVILREVGDRADKYPIVGVWFIKELRSPESFPTTSVSPTSMDLGESGVARC